MRILLRVDAGEQVGLGHFYRTMNLANKLAERGHRITIIHRASPFWSTISLPYHTVEVVSGKEDDTTLAMIKNGVFDIFYVDGIIDFTDDFCNEGRKYSKFIFYQNLSDSRSKCDLFILPSIHHPPSFFEVFGAATKVFVGLQYFAFNEKIERMTPSHLPSDDQAVVEVAVIAGGSDPSNFLMKLHKIISYSSFPRIKFIFYYGENYQHRDSLARVDTNSDVFFRPYSHEEILRAQLLISAYGVSTLEFLYLGLPIITLGHQVPNANAAKAVAEKTNAIIHAGFIDEIDSQSFNHLLHQVINNSVRRKELVINGRRVVDLNGINRIINIIENE